jgi:hypothetical protein
MEYISFNKNNILARNLSDRINALELEREKALCSNSSSSTSTSVAVAVADPETKKSKIDKDVEDLTRRMRMGNYIASLSGPLSYHELHSTSSSSSSTMPVTHMEEDTPMTSSSSSTIPVTYTANVPTTSSSSSSTMPVNDKEVDTPTTSSSIPLPKPKKVKDSAGSADDDRRVDLGPIMKANPTPPPQPRPKQSKPKAKQGGQDGFYDPDYPGMSRIQRDHARDVIMAPPMSVVRAMIKAAKPKKSEPIQAQYEQGGFSDFISYTLDWQEAEDKEREGELTIANLSRM